MTIAFSKLTRKVYPMQAYCMKCRARRAMEDAKAMIMKKDMPATHGMCPVCGTRMFRMEEELKRML